MLGEPLQRPDRDTGTSVAAVGAGVADFAAVLVGGTAAAVFARRDVLG